jgi:hypothetical protein
MGTDAKFFGFSPLQGKKTDRDPKTGFLGADFGVNNRHHNPVLFWAAVTEVLVLSTVDRLHQCYMVILRRRA